MQQDDRVSELPDNIELLLRQNSDGKVLAVAENLYLILRHHQLCRGRWRYNALTETDEYHIAGDGLDVIEVDGRAYGTGVMEVSDLDLFHVRRWLWTTFKLTREPSKELVADAVEAACRRDTYHPVRDYLAPLAAEWDGVERIDTWLHRYCRAEDTPYTRAAGRVTLLSACARAMTPGSKVDCMLVMVGRQGARKSTAIRTLGGQWTSDTPVEIGAKDGYEALRGAWIVEMSELAGMTGKDVERLKAFFSSPEDVYRPPYARKPIRRLRSNIFIGTTNDMDFLRDQTGSRRFHCVAVGDDIDSESLFEDRDQLWGEAALRYLEGAPWWLNGEQEDLAAGAAEAFTALDPWEDSIVSRLEGLERVHTRTIYDWLEIPERDRNAGTAARLVRIMCGRLGWVRPTSPIRIDGRQARGFVQPWMARDG